MTRLRDNASVAKAPRSYVRINQNSNFTVPTDVENIRITIAGGGGTGNSDAPGGDGGAAVVWARVTPGQVLQVRAARYARDSQVVGIVTAARGGNASGTTAGTRGAVTVQDSSATWVRIRAVDFSDGDDHYGALGVNGNGKHGIVVLEY